MGRYFILQWKRAARFLPCGLCVVLVLFGSLGILYRAMVSAQEAENAQQTAKIRVGIVGTAGDTYMQWGLAAMQFDSSAMSIQMVQMQEEEAVAALERGDIGAFVVFPEDFVGEALYGNVQQLRFVSTAGAAGLVSVIKEEVTVVIDRILVACESGSYGVGEALKDNGHGNLWGEHVNGLALEYVDFLFDRSKVYRVEPIQQDNFVPFDRYMLGGLTTLLLMLSALAFAPLYIRADQTLPRLLRSRHIGVWHQVLAEFAVYFIAMATLLAAVSIMIGIADILPGNTSGWHLFFGTLPGLLTVATLSFLLFSLSDHLIGGVLLTFFAVLAMCFAGGCMYPIIVFPVLLQRLAAILPSGLVRHSITSCIQGHSPGNVWALLGYSAVFFAVTVAIRGYKTEKVRG